MKCENACIDFGVAPKDRERARYPAQYQHVALFEYETPLLHLCPFLAHRGAAERCQRRRLV